MSGKLQKIIFRIALLSLILPLLPVSHGSVVAFFMSAPVRF